MYFLKTPSMYTEFRLSPFWGWTGQLCYDSSALDLCNCLPSNLTLTLTLFLAAQTLETTSHIYKKSVIFTLLYTFVSLLFNELNIWALDNVRINIGSLQNDLWRQWKKKQDKWRRECRRQSPTKIWKVNFVDPNLQHMCTLLLHVGGNISVKIAVGITALL